jgi:cytochrome c-type biogenesis protein CcmH
MGPGMPLAVVRKQVKDLPLQFTLDDSQAMSPMARLSLVKTATLSARISKSGKAMPQAGDLQGVAQGVAVGASGLKLEINEEVKP